MKLPKKSGKFLFHFLEIYFHLQVFTPRIIKDIVGIRNIVPIYPIFFEKSLFLNNGCYIIIWHIEHTYGDNEILKKEHYKEEYIRQDQG
jgi:hypothetical protein